LGISGPTTPIRFGAFELDATTGELRKAGIAVKLHPQPLRVLVLLTENAGHIVTREQIREQLWGRNTFVDFERGINFCINQVRTTLGDNHEKPRYVETLARRGYRFIAPVTMGTVATTPTVDERIAERPTDQSFPAVAAPTGTAGTMIHLPAAASNRKLKYFLAASGLVVITTAALGWQWLVRQKAASIRSIAVLPLENLSNDGGQEYLADGITDALTTDLANISALKVISRTSATRYRKTDKLLPQIGRELGVEAVVEGSVQRSGDRVRITAKLIEATTDKLMWAHSYERDMRDVFALERDVTEDIAHQIQARLATNTGSKQAQPRPMEPEALEAYLQGNYHLKKQGKGFGDEEKKEAAEYFQKAIAADPSFAPAYHGLALAHQNRLLGSSEDFANSRKADEKALEIDPNFSVARVNLAALKWTPDLDWRGAEEDLRQAISLNPNSAFAHSALCILLNIMAHVDEGLRECRIAQRLDPFDEDSVLGLYMGRDYDGSIAMLRTMLQADPNVAGWRSYLFSNYVMKGMYRESIPELVQCYSLFGQQEMAANIRRAFEASGYQEAIRQWAKEMEHLQATHQAFLPGNLAMAYTILGDKDRAFYWLEQAYEHRELSSFDEGVFYLGAEPLFDPLRSDPRFKDLLRRVGL
jgi:TolB-like protein/DNA-binding winged helix-turn-helix (wHTH) protein/tetratricopeptide (TPR) repeat protein